MSDIYGRNPVLEALRSGAEINRIYVAKGTRHAGINEIYDLARERNVQVQTVDRKRIDGLFPKENHQGVYASVAEMDYVPWQDMVAKAKAKGETPLLLVLDEIEDPHNLGAILRNADAFGAHGVIVPKRRSAALTGTVAKTSAGAIQYVPVDRVSNLADTLEALKKEGIWVCGSDADGDLMYQAPLEGALAIVIGSEGKGMRRIIREHCDFVVKIPMLGQVNSLNASVASGVLLAEVVRRRMAP